MHPNLDTSSVKTKTEHWLDELVVVDCCIEVELSEIEADQGTDQDMNWKVEWDIGLDVRYNSWKAEWYTDFGIGLGIGQDTTIDWDFGLSTDSDLDRVGSLVEQGHRYHHACNSNMKPHDPIL